ncbi:la protein homolog isoform X2 [Tigriopus californicus]|uniref:la protein homolog isoform X2 n=1 Tax=Tigriopus californicus TaxID=6832 RepID=UPI0027DA3E6D|nr:la protein homolog isoform X2 [Tigriopus californicus]
MAPLRPHLSALEMKVISQMEHYFGDHNLPRDRFMKRVIAENDGWISMSVMLKFQRLASLSRDRYFIMRCVQKSESGLIEVDFAKERVRRKPAKPYSTFVSGEESRQLKGRIVHVRGFEKIATLNDIITFFEEDVKGVCRVNEEDPNSNDHAWKNRMEEKFLDGDSRFPESVCVVFDSDKEAKGFLARKVMFRGKKLTSELKFDSGTTKSRLLIWLDWLDLIRALHTVQRHFRRRHHPKDGLGGWIRQAAEESRKFGRVFLPVQRSGSHQEKEVSFQSRRQLGILRVRFRHL